MVSGLSGVGYVCRRFVMSISILRWSIRSMMVAVTEKRVGSLDQGRACTPMIGPGGTRRAWWLPPGLRRSGTGESKHGRPGVGTRHRRAPMVERSGAGRMSIAVRVRAPVAAWVVALFLVAGTLTLSALNGSFSFDPVFVPLAIAMVVGYATVGALLASRNPRNPIN